MKKLINNMFEKLGYYPLRKRDKLELPKKAPKKIYDAVKKLHPRFTCYVSTIGEDNKPVVVIHRCTTQTELFKEVKRKGVNK